MMGERRVDQGALFYEFSLERHVPAGHLLRAIDRFVDLADLRVQLAPFYSSMGRPSIDPELLIRMLLIGYCLASAPSDGCARRYTSTLHIAGSVGLASMARCPITRPSRRTGTGVSARVICCAIPVVAIGAMAGRPLLRWLVPYSARGQNDPTPEVIWLG